MATLRRHGITSYRHAARKVNKGDFLKFDYILAMDKYNLRDLLDTREAVVNSLNRKADPKSAAKNTRAARDAALGAAGEDAKIAEVRLFGDFGRDGKLHAHVGGGEVVQDPYYGGADGFEDVYKQVVRFSQGFLEYLEIKR